VKSDAKDIELIYAANNKCRVLKSPLVIIILLILILAVIIFLSMGIASYVCHTHVLSDSAAFNLTLFPFKAINVSTTGDVTFYFGVAIDDFVMNYTLTDPNSFGEMKVSFTDYIAQFHILPVSFSLCTNSELVFLIPDSFDVLEAVIVNTGGKITLIGDMNINYLELRTGNNVISVEGDIVGRVMNCSNNNGEIQFGRVKMERIELRTTNAAIKGMLSANESLIAESKNGDIKIEGFDPRGVNPKISVQTTNADIAFDLFASNYNSNFDMKTSNGANTIFNSGTATVTKTEDTTTHISGTINNGGASFNLKTTNGDITLSLLSQ